MGEYVGIRIKNHVYLQWKNSFGDLLSIFSKEDLHIESVRIGDETYIKRYYATTVLKAKMILDGLGYTVSAAKEDFERSKSADLEYCEEEKEYKDIEELFTFDEWERAVKKFALVLSAREKDLFNEKFESFKKKRQDLSFVEQMVMGTAPLVFEERYFGLHYEEINLWNIFRVILDAFEDDETVELDYTDLLEGGWCEEIPDEKEFEVPKTIILTEGKFDAEAISKSIDLLFPHMKKLYSFINFSAYRVQGSTNFLTHYLKAFIASGIQNRVIAIYDNDSAGSGELLNFLNIPIPDNFRILRLPDLNFANHYPTLGPSGKEYMNINRRACSIELFLGRDVLTECGEWIPVQWKGFNEQTQTYQGEILEKSLIQDKFRKKACQSSSGLVDKSSWQDMCHLLHTIFEVFLDHAS